MKKNSIILTILALSVSFVFAIGQNNKLDVTPPPPPPSPIQQPAMAAPGLNTPETTQIKEETKVKTESISSSSLQQPAVITKQTAQVVNNVKKSPISGSDTSRPLMQEEIAKLKDSPPAPSNINKPAPDVINATDTPAPNTAVVIEEQEKKSFFSRMIDFFISLFKK